jgi:hypothetical protein
VAAAAVELQPRVSIYFKLMTLTEAQESGDLLKASALRYRGFHFWKTCHLVPPFSFGSATTNSFAGL